MWASRIIHEASLYDHKFGNSFVTLTYRSPWECTSDQRKNGYYLPADYSLDKSHLRDFIKRLRHHTPQKIRYFACGEYGELWKRPHYHAILFNYFPDDARLVRTRDGISLYHSETLEDIWRYGFVTVGEVTHESAGYTARYALKKITGPQADEHYLRYDEYGVCSWVLPEFVVMSRGGRSGKGKKCGIGAEWYEKYKTDIFPSDECPIPFTSIISKQVPRYYAEMLRDESEDAFEDVKSKRAQFRAKHKEDYTPERLMDRYKVKKAQIKSLKREVE